MTIQNSDVERITSNLMEITGLKLAGKKGDKDGYPHIRFRTLEPESPHGFSVCSRFFWRRVEIVFIPDTYSKPLIESMAHSMENNLLFSELANQIIKDSGKIEFEINNKNADPKNPEAWESHWTNLKFKLEIFYDKGRPEDISESEEFITIWVGRFLTMIISLLPCEEIQEDTENQGLPEGAVVQILVNRYERKSINRTACISLHGNYCHVCGFRFEEYYGDIGKGFIEVHHLVPVSKIGENYIVNPLTDLIPICSNCHSMLHKKNPPLAPRELKTRLK